MMLTASVGARLRRLDVTPISAERGELADRLTRHLGALPVAKLAPAGNVLSDWESVCPRCSQSSTLDYSILDRDH